MDDNDCIKKLTFLFLGSVSSLPESYVKLRSILNLNFSNVAEIFNVKLPKYFTNNKVSCPYCYTQWTHNFKCIKLLSCTGKKFKLNTNKNSLIKNSATNSILNDVLYTRNKLVLKCKVCTKKCEFTLEKPVNYQKNKPKQKTNVVLKKKNNNKIQNLSEGKVIAVDNNCKIKEKKSNKKGLPFPSKNTAVVSEQIICNKYFQQNKNLRFTKLEPKELCQEGEPVLYSNIKKQFLRSSFNNTTIKKKSQLNNLKRALKNKASISKNSLRDLLTVIN